MKYPSFNRNYIAVLITLVFVIFCGAIYFLIYVPNNERDLQEQRFRTLQNIDVNIHKKIENSVSLLSNLLDGFAKDDSTERYVSKYINNYSRENFTLTLPEVQVKNKIVRNGRIDSSYSIAVNNESQLITLQLEKKIIDGTDTTSYKMSMNFSFGQFIKLLFPENIFDQYLVFSKRALVYETFPSGINYLNDSLVDKKNGNQISSVKSLNISGIDYKLFSQPVNFNADNEWVITGLLSDNRYQAEKNQLPASAILLLVTIAFIIIVAFPWIKLYQMGSKDRLTVSDGIASIAVSMLLMSLLFFTFFKYKTVLRPDNSSFSKDTLARQITAAFQKEISTVYHTLKLFEDSIKSNPTLFHDLINFNTDSVSFKDDSPVRRQLFGDSTMDLSISQVLWMDKYGNENINWIAKGMNPLHGNFRNRSYFKNIINKKEYLLDKDTSRKYFLDQIISWTSNEFTSVLSIPSTLKGEEIGAVSFTFQSLHKTVLPAGYLFAIIDGNGNVLYHSDEAHNLNENLLNEFSEKDKLLTNIEARTKDVFITKYFGKEYNVNIQPINGLPYFIVILGDKSYKETRDTEIYSFTLSMMLLFFGFLIFELFVVFLVSSRRSFFKRQFFDTSWIGPRYSSHHQYNLATLFNALVILLVIAFFRTSTFLTYLFILLFSVTFISAFLTALFARRYKQNNQTDNYKFKRTTLTWLLIFIVMIDVTALRTLDGSSILWLLFYQLIIVIAGIIFFKYGDKLLGKIRNHAGKKLLSQWNYIRSFSLMGLSRLIITSAIPIIFFYITSYNYEENISIRYRQLQFANQLLNKIDNVTQDEIENNSDFRRGYYYDGAWIHKMTIQHIKPPQPYSKEEIITARMLSQFRINISSAAVKEENFYSPFAADTSFFYNPLLKDACKLNSKSITYVETRVPGQYLAIAALGLNYKMPSPFGEGWFGGMLFWGLLLVSICIFYFIIYSVICKLFSLNMPDLTKWNLLDDKIITGSKLNQLLFIIGLPGSGKLSIIKEKIKNSEIKDDNVSLVYKEEDESASNVFIADLMNIPDAGDDRESNPDWQALKVKAFDKKNKLIVVNHFEYNIEDAATNRLKLNFLESVMLDSKCKIIILSTIHPVSFLDSITDQVLEADDKAAPGQDLDRWHVLFGHYRIIIFPLERSSAIESPRQWDAIYKEAGQTHFLINMSEDAVQSANVLTQKGTIVNVDELTFKLQVTAQYFYMYIWKSLTKEEKFLLYDLAEDNLVNSYDEYNLNLLLAKGVIVRDEGVGMLRLFNKGFRNFILTAIGNSEAMKIKRSIKDNGNWNRLKSPLLIILMAILVFLLTSQQEMYSRLLSYVAALTAGVPVILKLFSIFGKSDQKSN
ncbi:MAG: cache domain-containing protein [Ginsengibacter sp.]